MPVRSCDVLVAGAGIIGATTALALADQGLTVVCAGEPATTLGTASSAAGAMLGVLGEVTAADDTTAGSLDEAELHLRHHSAHAWPALAARLAELTGRCPQIHYGTAVIAVKPIDRANLAAIRAAAERVDLPCEPILPEDLPYLSPAPGHDTIDARWLPEEGHLDTSLLLPAVREALAAHPRVHRAPQLVRRVLHDNRRVTGAVLDDGTTVHTGHLVLAAGVGTQALLDDLGERTGVTARLLAGKGTAVCLHDPGHTLQREVIRTPTREFACGIHLIGRADGALYLGATNGTANNPGTDARASAGEVTTLLDSAMHEINTDLRTATITEIRYGMRPLSSDGYPLIGPTHLPGLHMATGTYRNGILLAPAIAEILAATIGGQNPPAGNPFVPTADRRPRAPGLRALLQAGVPHFVSVLLEPHGRLPCNRQRELAEALNSLVRLAFTDAHDLATLGR